MTRLILGVILGLIIGVYLTDRANESRAVRSLYQRVKADEPDGPEDMGLDPSELFK